MAGSFPQDRQLLHWINVEIPAYLDKCGSFEVFNQNMPAACASANWKRFAYAMAKERWGVPHVDRIPR